MLVAHGRIFGIDVPWVDCGPSLPRTMRILLRVLAVLVAIAFVATTLVVAFFHPWATQGLRAGVYKEVLVSERLYERVPELVAESVRVASEARERTAHETGESGSTDAQDPFVVALTRLETEDWTALLGGAVPPDMLRAEVERCLDQLEAYLYDDAANLLPAISFVEVKQRIAGAPMREAYEALLARKPPCSAEQWEDSLGLPVNCRPTPDQMAAALENFGELTRIMAERIPESLDPLEGLIEADGAEDVLSRLGAWRGTVRRTERIARWSPVIPVALALLIVVCAVRSLREWLLWWGIPFLVAGGMGSVVAVGMISMGIGMVNGIATADVPPEAPMAWIEAIFGLSSALVRALMLPALGVSLTLALVGFAMVVIAFLTRPKATPPPLARA